MKGKNLAEKSRKVLGTRDLANAFATAAFRSLDHDGKSNLLCRFQGLLQVTHAALLVHIIGHLPNNDGRAMCT